jgi:hypothetical protein
MTDVTRNPFALGFTRQALCTRLQLDAMFESASRQCPPGVATECVPPHEGAPAGRAGRAAERGRAPSWRRSVPRDRCQPFKKAGQPVSKETQDKDRHPGPEQDPAVLETELPYVHKENIPMSGST